MRIFGERLKKLRLESGMTQDELAKKFLLNKSSVSRYERGAQLPEIDILKKIADLFDVSTDYLLGRTDEPQAAILKGDDLPKKLKDEGIKEVAVLKEFKDSGLSEQEIIELIRFYKNIKKDSN